jgi:hypothetical protein
MKYEIREINSNYDAQLWLVSDENSYIVQPDDIEANVLYQQWLSEGNIPETINYVEPNPIIDVEPIIEDIITPTEEPVIVHVPVITYIHKEVNNIHEFDIYKSIDGEHSIITQDDSDYQDWLLTNTPIVYPFVELYVTPAQIPFRTYEHREISSYNDYEVWYVSENCTKQVSKDKPDYLTWINEGNFPNMVGYIEPAQISLETLRQARRDEVDAKTDAIFENGMAWQGHQWKCDKVHFDDYKDACQQIMSGLASEILIHGIGQDAYVVLNSSNVQSFFVQGKAFKLNTMFDGYKIKDMGGLLSDNVTTVKALKDMTYAELKTWVDPR